MTDFDPVRPLPWQVGTWTRLQQAIDAGRPAHALLLEGRPGTGRTQFSSALAAQLLCERPTPEGACGTCKSCSLFSAGSHADFLSLEPLEEGKAIGIDAVREALQFLSRTPSLGVHKVLRVTPAQRMTPAAFNAFLKGLEEPPRGTTIMLVTAIGHPIPATIRSRCQRWQLPEPSAEESLALLRDFIGAQAGDEAGKGDERKGDEREAARLESLVPRRPFHALERLEHDSASALLALRDALAANEIEGAGASARWRAQVLERAAQVDIDTFLNMAEAALGRFLRTCTGAQLRGSQARLAFAGLDDIARQRAAIRAGSNPNPDLLRHRSIGFLVDSLLPRA